MPADERLDLQMDVGWQGRNHGAREAECGAERSRLATARYSALVDYWG
jgi:hypothetical protein